MADMDPATAALIAQLMAEDLDKAYESHSRPIGASWHDYEEPLSSYERQCLDAEYDSDGQGDERPGWDPVDSDEINRAATPNEPASDGSWDSSFMNGDAQVQRSTGSEHASQVAVTDDEGNRSDPEPCSMAPSEGPANTPARIEPAPTCDVPTKQACEVRNVSDPVAIPIETAPVARPGSVQIPQDHVDPSDDPTCCEPVVSPNPALNEQPTVSTQWDVEDKWHDGLDYSSNKGKGKAVRAFDEFKLGLRYDEIQSRARRYRKKEGSGDDDDDSEDESEDKSEVDDGDLLFFRVPWPTTEQDEVLSRREDASVVEIRVEDDETLESILRDIDLKGQLKGIGGGGEEVLKGKIGAGWW